MPEPRKPRTRSSTRKAKEVEIEQKEEKKAPVVEPVKTDIQTNTKICELSQWKSWGFWLGLILLIALGPYQYAIPAAIITIMYAITRCMVYYDITF